MAFISDPEVRATNIQRAAFEALHEIAAEQGALDVLDMLDVSVDYRSEEIGFKVRVDCRRIYFWECNMPIARSYASRAALKDDLRMAMDGTLQMIGAKWHVQIDQMFPKQVKKVEVEVRLETMEKIISVWFKNGQCARVPESEMLTDEFVARCLMLYDLPP